MATDEVLMGTVAMFGGEFLISAICVFFGLILVGCMAKSLPCLVDLKILSRSKHGRSVVLVCIFTRVGGSDAAELMLDHRCRTC